MARYEHLPIYRAAFDLAVHIEKIVHNFSRYHKYTLGTELREGSRRILERIIEANQSRDRGPVLEQLRRELEGFKVLAWLCHESQGGTRAYLHVAEQVVALSKQNEGWPRQTARSRVGPDQERAPMGPPLARAPRTSELACSPDQMCLGSGRLSGLAP